MTHPRIIRLLGRKDYLSFVSVIFSRENDPFSFTDSLPGWKYRSGHVGYPGLQLFGGREEQGGYGGMVETRVHGSEGFADFYRGGACAVQRIFVSRVSLRLPLEYELPKEVHSRHSSVRSGD